MSDPIPPASDPVDANVTPPAAEPTVNPYAAPAAPAANPYAAPGTTPPAANPYAAPGATPYSNAPVAGAKTNTLAIIALILGIVVPLGGIITGHIALGQIKRTGEAGRGLALAGTIIGYALTALGILITIGYIILFASLAAAGNAYDYNY